MEYRVEISDVALAEIDAAYLYLSSRSPEAAIRWLRGLEAAINSLSMFPGRCPIAPESESYPDIEVRQLLYGRGRSVYRILYCVFDREDEPEVRILHVRHGARRRITPDSEAPGNSAG
jgi:plasmid stabilization system protein ParE